MTPAPKPEKRGPKPPRRIVRRRTRSRMPKGLAQHRELEKVADCLWREIVRAGAGGDPGDKPCERCRMRPGHDAHHLVSRSYRQTRWLPDNGAFLCSNCHRIVGVDGEENRALAVRLIGAERWELLNVQKHFKVKPDPLAAAIALRYEAERLGVKL